MGLEGQRIADRFVLEHLAGEGGMGAVYRAIDGANGVPVALKLVLDARGDALDRFDREIALLATLDHPCIVRHVAHGRTGSGEPYLAMEWIDGEDLAQRLARGPLPVAEAVALVSRVADALALVHERGVVHRDVKPSNVFLRGSDSGQPVLLDFGIARRADATVALTRTGGVIGTPQYMAPEQVRGERDIGPAADVFALGCVLFECLTGRPAFVGEHAMAVLAKILLEEPPPARDLSPSVPSGVDALLRSMLAKRPDARTTSCRELADRLVKLAHGSTEHTNAAPASLTSRERRLISVVLARDPAGDTDRTITPAALDAARAELKRNIHSLDGQLAPIGSSHIVVTVPSASAAVDQATTAARCARTLARALPQATVALAMGWAEVEPVPVGEVIDRAASMLVRGAGSIHVDDVSADLLELRFEMVGAAGKRTLGGERTSNEPPRTLLGRETPCVGRDRELSVLLGLVGEVVDDAVARVALVTAPAGVGKSRLRHELSLRIARDHAAAAVHLARAESFRANASLDLIGQIVRHAAGIREGDDPAKSRTRLLSRVEGVRAQGRDPMEVAASLGEIASVPFEDSVSTRLAAARRDNRLLGELMMAGWLAFLECELARHPVVLVLEDLHWADAQTVRFVDVALRDLADQSLLVLALARPEAKTRFGKLWSDRAVQEIALPPLNARAAERLVRDVLADVRQEDLERIVRQSEGNALFLEELIRAAASGRIDEASGTVVAMVQTRLQSLDADERRVLRAASVFGESFLVDDVAALIGGSGETRSRLDALVEREVMVRRPNAEGEIAFRHALVREAAYAMLTLEDRRRAHALAAQHLEARGSIDAFVIAEHWDIAGDASRAAVAWAEAARQALAKNDFDAALVHGAAALARTEDRRVNAKAFAIRGRALACLGRWAEAQAALEDALRLSPDMEPEMRADLLLEHLWFVGVFRQDSAVIRLAGSEARAAAERAGRHDLVAEAEVALAVADHADGICVPGLARFRASIGQVRARPGPPVGLASIILYHAAEYIEAEEVMRRMLVVAEENGDATTETVLGANLGLALAGLGRYVEADQCFDRSRACGMRYGLTTLVARTASTSAGYLLDVYRFDEVERRANEACEIGKELEFATPRVSAALDLATSAVRQGQCERARAILDSVTDVVSHAPGFHGWIWRGRLVVIRAEIAEGLGDHATALALSSASIPAFEGVARVKYRLLAEHVVARSLAALGRLDEAIERADRSLEVARTYPDPAMLLRAAAVRLRLAREESARTALAESAARIERAMPDEAARATFRNAAPLGAIA